MPNIFANIGRRHLGRSTFNLSHEVKMTCNMGQLIPVMHVSMVPGDVFKIGHEFIVRLMPLVAPILHPINIYYHVFFVPFRLLWNEAVGDDSSWEDFITGGITGDLAPEVPKWMPNATDIAVGSLYDYMGFPTGVYATDAEPMDFPRRAYNFIWNEYYRPQELATPVALSNREILYRSWAKDYFTSALLDQQRGTAPGVPVSGSTAAEWTGSINAGLGFPAFDATNPAGMVHNQAANAPGDAATKSTLEGGHATVTDTALNNNVVNLAGASAVDVADLRLAVQMQRVLELNNRTGARYVEWLKGTFGINPRDDRLQRPEYVGGSRNPVIISEVLQTSQTGTTPQGNLAGHGIGASQQYCGTYRAKEFGILMGIMSIVPTALYQQGVERQWNSACHTTRWDFYHPALAHLSEQAVLRSELFANNVGVENTTIFGYQGRYNEMRYMASRVVSKMRATFDYWHISRQFASAPELNNSFVLMSASSPRRDCFAAPSEDGFMVSWGNLIHAIRPIPIESQPGFMDH